MGWKPVIASQTSMFLVFVSSLVATLQYFMYSKVLLDYAAGTAILSFFGAMAGVYFIMERIKRT